MSQDRIAVKIRKLLAIAGDAEASDEEIQNAMGFANRLMEKHHLSEEDLQDESDPVEELKNAELGQFASFIGKRMYRWEGELAAFVARFVGCRVYRRKAITQARRHNRVLFNQDGEPWEGQSFQFYGVAEDCLIAAELYDELRQLICSMAVLRYGGMYKGDGGRYSQGFVSGLESQIDKAREQAKLEASSTETGLIVSEKRNEIIQVKNQLAKKYLRSKGVRLSRRQGSQGATGSNSAYNRGFSDGKNANINGARRRKLN